MNPMAMQPAPKSLRLHIGLFGRRNVGKSSLLNAITRQQVSIVSAFAGTTTDPVEKPMELLPLGPVLFVDTAGVDDEGALGELRMARTRAVLDRVDLGVIVTDRGDWGAFEAHLLAELQARKVPVDVSTGAAAAGIAIDFMGRFQAEMSALPGGQPVMAYVTPVGGSSVTADPVSLLRGAPHRALAVRFVEYVLGEEGQKLWNYRPGTPGGPRRYALRRLPIRRDFYPSDNPVLQASFEAHRPFLADPLWQPEVDAYQVGLSFLYVPRWTSVHFGIQRDLIRAMCMDSGDELRGAWQAILSHGGPDKNPEAMRLLEALPEKPVPLTWASAVTAYAKVPRLDYLREWTAFFREQYRRAEAAANRSGSCARP